MYKNISVQLTIRFPLVLLIGGLRTGGSAKRRPAAAALLLHCS